jgi:hypothetical protein
MSVKKTDPELLRDDGPVKFVQGKESRFQPDLSGRRAYYSVVKHSRFQPSMQNKFLQSFGSQVVPLELPNLGGPIQPPVPVQVGYLISETGLYLMSENNENLTEE